MKPPHRTIQVVVAILLCAVALGACAVHAQRTLDIGQTPGHGARSHANGDRPVGIADGHIPGNETLSPFDVNLPAIANLDADLRQAVQDAARAASQEGVELRINSGWRSAHLQRYLLKQAVTKYGSLQEARRWVNTPQQSTHVSGDAIDVAPVDAMSWMSQHGSEFGLCQMYGNEAWHFELAVEPGQTCPAPRSDATDD